MRNRLALSFLFGMGLAGAACAQGASKFDGQYVGELTLTATISGDCTQPPLGALYPLTISGGRVEFKYVPRFNTTLVGKVDRNGRFKAVRRLRRGSVRMRGHIQGSTLTASIESPSCNYTFHTRE